MSLCVYLVRRKQTDRACVPEVPAVRRLALALFSFRVWQVQPTTSQFQAMNVNTPAADLEQRIKNSEDARAYAYQHLTRSADVKLQIAGTCLESIVDAAGVLAN